MDQAVAASLQSQRMQAERRTLDNRQGEASRMWPPPPPGGHQSLKYFGIEVPTITHPLDLTRGEAFITDFGELYHLDARVIRYLLENEGIDCLRGFVSHSLRTTITEVW